MSLSYGYEQASRRFGRESRMISGRRTIPASVRGWNTRDSLSEMKPGFAVFCDNALPELGRVRQRRGCEEHATAGTADIETLVSHTAGTVNKFYAFGGGGMWDISTTTAAEVTAAGTYTNNRWHHSSMLGSTILCNGVDAPLRIQPDGTLASAHGWTGTGLTPTTLTGVITHKTRLMFVEANSTALWYSSSAAITGALNKFDVGTFYPEGGTVKALGTLTVDSGTGVDDLLCVFLSSGAVLVYQGVDISDANAFGLVGIFNMGQLVGDRPLVKLGGDLIAITTDGYVPVRMLINAGRQARSVLALSDAIAPSVSESVRLYSGNPGWQAILHAPANWLLFNIPAGAGTVQHVQNTQTGAWCRFRGWPAKCWARHNDRLYYGAAAGKIYQADRGGADAGEPITVDIQPAFNYLGTSKDKHFKMIRALVESNGNASYGLDAVVDFEEAGGFAAPSTLEQAGNPWDTSAWDAVKWGGGTVRDNDWRTVNAIGSSLSVRFCATTRNARMSIAAMDVVYEALEGIIA